LGKGLDLILMILEIGQKFRAWFHVKP